MVIGGRRLLYHARGRNGAMSVGRAAAVLVATLAFGCARGPSPQTALLRPVVMPDLSLAAESVREQARVRAQALTQAIAAAQTAPSARAAAFGELGKLLLAAEYGEAAETCFADAELL